MYPVKKAIRYMAKNHGIELDDAAVDIIADQVVNKNEYNMLIKFVESMIRVADESKRE